MAAHQVADRAYDALADAQALLDRLIESARGMDDRAWIDEVQQTAEDLHDVLIEHCRESEEQDGILAAATGAKPALIPESEHLIDEHTDMIRHAQDLAREAENEAAFDDVDIELIRLKASVLRDLVRVHLHRSGVLTYEAYYRVEGGEGGG